MIRKRKIIKRVRLGIKRRPQTSSSFQNYSPREKLQDCIWVFTIGDPDDNPSVPHAHAQEHGYRLDAWTGDIYPAGNERNRTIGKLKRKELDKLHSDSAFIRFAKKQIEWYRENKPQINFFVPDWFEIKCQQRRGLTRKEEQVEDYFIFVGRASIRK